MTFVWSPVFSASARSRSSVESELPDTGAVPVGTDRSGAGACLRGWIFNCASNLATANANLTGSVTAASSLAFFGFLPSA